MNNGVESTFVPKYDIRLYEYGTYHWALGSLSPGVTHGIFNVTDNVVVINSYPTRFYYNNYYWYTEFAPGTGPVLFAGKTYRSMSSETTIWCNAADTQGRGVFWVYGDAP